MREFAQAMWTVMLELAPWLLLGAAVAGLLHVLLPVGFVQRNLQGRGGVAKAVLLGVPLPLCSCGVIPAGLGLKRDGASNGASVAFLISTPQTGVDSILVSASMLGWPFALFKVLSAAVLGLIGGFAADSKAKGEIKEAKDGPRPTWRAGVAHSIEMVRTIWAWLIFGVFVSAAITVFLPADSFASLGAVHGLAAMGLMLLVSVPLYVCATASVPIAAALVASGFPAGAALVFLIAGPATNLATLGAVGGAFGKRVLAIYLGTIVVGSVILGYAFDFLVEGNLAVGHVHGRNPVAAISAVVLLLMLAYFAGEAVYHRFRRPPEGFVLDVEGMTCGGCAKKVERAILDLPGVSEAMVSFDTKTATVSLKAGADASGVHATIEALGYEVRPARASVT